ncbi:MAG: ABC transporter ATP-binding protein, partial [Propionibacteriaceae bacterium]|nr:ABC transporter ATP-binding protein [Propionibacteriaceae bacterium]
MIHAMGVSKAYGKTLAVDNVSLHVRPGELTVLLGPNGAGKSTLIKSVCGLLRYTGVIRVGGFENRSADARRLLGYVPEFPALYPLLTTAEHLEFIARAYRLTDWRSRADALLERFDLADKRSKLGRELSKGMQQKVSVCCALLPEPRALILDEPLVGLDPHGIRTLKSTLAELKEQGAALIVSTHMIDSVEANWDQTAIMVGGRVARTVGRDQLGDDATLEDVYFATIDDAGKDAPDPVDTPAASSQPVGRAAPKRSVSRAATLSRLAASASPARPAASASPGRPAAPTTSDRPDSPVTPDHPDAPVVSAHP